MTITNDQLEAWEKLAEAASPKFEIDHIEQYGLVLIFKEPFSLNGGIATKEWWISWQKVKDLIGKALSSAANSELIAALRERDAEVKRLGELAVPGRICQEISDLKIALSERDAKIERLSAVGESDRKEIARLNHECVCAEKVARNWHNDLLAARDQLRIAREALEFITTGPERHDDTFEAHKSNRDRLRAAVLRARAALEKMGASK